MVSITQAFAVDMTGQVCGTSSEGEFHGGVSTQAGFIRGAARSPAASRSSSGIHCADDGTSRIKPLLETGMGWNRAVGRALRGYRIRHRVPVWKVVRERAWR
jgi:acyl-CoA hydrolase